VFVLGDAVVFDFSLIGQAQAVFAIEVIGSAGSGFQGGGGACREGDQLLDALVLGAVEEAERALGAGAIGAGGGVVGEELALGAGELVAGGARFWASRLF
jgi:hypothetical protein